MHRHVPLLPHRRYGLVTLKLMDVWPLRGQLSQLYFRARQ